MKKVFVLFVLTIIPYVSNAQRVDKPGEPYEFYCHTSVDYFKHRTSNVTLIFANENYLLLNEKGEEIKVTEKMYSPLEIKLFMSKRGWEYVGSDGVYTLTFKKIVTSDEQAKEGLYLKKTLSREGVSPFCNL